MAEVPEVPIEISDISDDGESYSEDESNEEEPYLENEYDEETYCDGLKTDLLSCLDKIRTTGNVAVSKQHDSFVNPGLTVADTLIPLPLVPRDAETIKGVCREAPFGRGDETVVDTSVRKTWELNHTQFRCSNPEWLTYLTSLSKDAEQKLAMSNVIVAPYKLLLYEEGSFFKPHKDSEKVPGMIATLVICLPSKHQGGSVHLSHAGKKYVFDTDKSSEFGLTSLSWFSDVTHEIKPLTSGYRLVLTYNIIHGGGVRMSAGLVDKQSAHLRSLLIKWRTNLPHREMLVYLLEHKYTQSSLSLENLKGRDRVVCQSLSEVGLECEFTIFLAKMTRTSEDSDYGDYDDPDEDWTQLQDIKTCDGFTICGSADVEDKEILGTDVWNRDPDSQDEGEFTGNESMPATLRYHDAVVIIVPIRNLLGLFGRPDPNALMNFVSKSLRDRPDDHGAHTPLLKILEGAIDKVHTRVDGALLSNIVTMAVKLENWALYRAAVRASLRNTSSQSLVFPTIAQCMNQAFRKDPSTPPDWNFWLGEVTTELPMYSLKSLVYILPQLDLLVQHEDLKASFQEWKKPIAGKAVELKPRLDLNDCDFLIGLLTSQFSDSSWLASWFTPILAKRGSKPLICGILRAVHHIHRHNTLPGAKDVFQCILEGCAGALALETGDLPKPSLSTKEHKFQCDEATTLRSFLTVLHQGFSIGLSRQTTELLEKSCTNICQSSTKAKYACPIIVRHFLLNLTSTLTVHNVPPLESVKQLYILLLRDVLISSPPKRPSKPRGWTHKPRACSPYCAECKELNVFLLDSEAQTRQFRMLEKKRKHIESQLPPDLFLRQTDKSRTPYALIVTKTGREYGEELQKYNASIAAVVKQVSKFQCEHVQSLLGDDLYQELVLLKGLVGPEGVQQTDKRKADEELDGSSASRPRLIE